MIRAQSAPGTSTRGEGPSRRWGALAAATAAALVAGSCATTSGYSRDQTEAMQRSALAYLAQGDPTLDHPQLLATYTTVEPGDTEVLPRAFPGAPPQVPHAIEDLLPITAAENPCFACHLPNTAGDGDIPAPASHFDAPGIVVGSRAAPPPGAPPGAALSYVAGYAAEEDLVGARYNCVQCHTPRAQNLAATSP